MLGWATQLIGGVALWMFPPLSREQPRGDERLGWFAYGALNGGLLLRAVRADRELEYTSLTAPRHKLEGGDPVKAAREWARDVLSSPMGPRK